MIIIILLHSNIYGYLISVLCLFLSLKGLAEDGVSGISQFFQSLEKLLTGQEPALHKKSLFGTSKIQLSAQGSLQIQLFLLTPWC